MSSWNALADADFVADANDDARQREFDRATALARKHERPLADRPDDVFELFRLVGFPAEPNRQIIEGEFIL